MTCAVSAPVFSVDVNTCSVTVPYTKGIDTVLFGVNGHIQTPITSDVTVTGSFDGAVNTAAQFWIDYKAQPGYVISNPGAAPTTSTSTTAIYVRGLRRDRQRDVGLPGQRHRHRHLQRERDRRLARLPEQQRHVAPRRRHLVQADRRPHGRLRRHDHRRQRRLHRQPPDPDYFFAKVVDDYGSNGDQIAVLGNKAPPTPVATTTCLWAQGSSATATWSSATTLPINRQSTGASPPPLPFYRGRSAIALTTRAVAT